MFEVEITKSFSSAHCLRGYKGKCEALHGHNWKVDFVARAEELDELGMVVDFTIFKKEANALLEIYDHVYLNETAPFDEINPSSENIAKVFFEVMSEKINDDRVRMVSVAVWESEGSKATYRPSK
jgi:6-pyruvoyltetrahydropterin/6-carboxytetrahydropterin synthase